MQRIAETLLATWAGTSGRKPLVLRGARQTGKTWLIKHVGEQFHGDMAYINLEREPDLAVCFQPNDPKAVLALLEARLRRTITPGKTLLFLDEIQACPRALMALRYFYEQLPELHVIAAGSLPSSSAGMYPSVA